MRAAFSWLNPDADGIWSDDPNSAVEELLRAVTVDHVGALLVGTPEDRRAVTQEAVDRLRAERPVYHLHGSEFVADLPYGALSILQARSDVGPAPTWFRMAKVLGDFLAPEGQEPAVVFLSRPRQMDQGSITVLAQLAHQRRVVLVVQCDRTTDVPADLAALARAGNLARVGVRPLTPSGTRALLVDHLGGPVSRVAATVLWRYGGGHLGRLRSIADDCVASGKLRRSDGRWVLVDGPLQSGRGIPGEDVVLRRLPADRRALLEALAVRGCVEVGGLVHDDSGRELDALQAQGIVTMRRTPSGTLAQVEPMWRDRVLAGLEPERRQALEQEATARDGLARTLNRAQDLLASVDVGGALAVLATVPALDDPRPGPADPDLAPHGPEEHDDAPPPGAAADVRGHLVWMSARALLAAGDVGGADSLVTAAARAGDPCLIVLSATIAALVGDRPRSERLLAETRATQEGSRLDPRPAGRNRETVRLRAEATCAELLALGDDQDAARSLVAGLDSTLSTFRARGVLDSVIGPYDRAAIAVSMLETTVRCGDLELARAMAQGLVVARHGNPQAVLDAELVLAAVDLLVGLPDRAEEAALELVEQARAMGNDHAEEVALTIVESCRSGTGRLDETSVPRWTEQRVRRAADGPTQWGRLGWLTAVIGAVTPDPDRADAGAPARLAVLADRAAAAGHHLVEMHALLSAALVGDRGVADRLRAVAARTQAVVSRACEALGDAVLDDDHVRSAAALTEMAEAGYLAWRYSGPASMIASLPAANARRLAGAVARIQVPAAPQAADDTPGWLQALTPREREIAGMVVDGLSNASIARRHSISVRTVEGHLNQVYAKLQVRGRWGLSRLAAESPALRTAGDPA
ncbi:LuxR C-terminal-related transcriptional regulator [Georgenia sp. Z1344]|uniref:helix-turn-helix transcriptional regulator n=1 Tax=Georgenia sp. Z1344 TaxID=3416706 RepID=UPI003CF62AB7